MNLDRTTGCIRDTPKSYWEEKWRVLHNQEEEYKQAGVEEKVPHITKGWSDRVKHNLSKTEADPSSPTKNERTSTKNERTNLPDPTGRKSLLNDLARQLGSADDEENALCSENVENQYSADVNGQDDADKASVDILNRAVSVENCLNLSNPQSPNSRSIDHEIMSERSSVASNSSIDGNYAESCRTHTKPSPLLVPSISPDVSSGCPQNDDSIAKSPRLIQYTRTLSGKFNWLLKLGRNANEGTSERPSSSEGAKESDGDIGQNSVAGFSEANACEGSSGTSKGKTVDQKLMVSLRNLAQSMLENIEVIESVFQHDSVQLGAPGKGHITAMSALKELRKISSILSEM